MSLSALRRLMPGASHSHSLSARYHRQVQRRLAHICPPFACLSRNNRHRKMSTAPTTNPPTTATLTATATQPTSAPPITFTPCHDVLAEIQPHHRVLFVGDVHGCYDELQRLITAAHITAGTDYILLTGDLVAKGPQPLAVIEWLLRTPRAYSVLGNHDHHVIAAMQRRQTAATTVTTTSQPPPIDEPDYATRPHDYVAAHMTDEQRAYYLRMPLSIRLPGLSRPHLMVHAGLVPGVALGEQRVFDLLNVRNVLEDGSGSKGRKEGVNWVERYGGEEGVVVFGHCAARGVQLVKDEGGDMRCIGLDSGCCYGKELSGWLLPDNRLVQVKAQCMYSNPDE